MTGLIDLFRFRRFAGGIVLPEQRGRMRVERIEPFSGGRIVRVPLRGPAGRGAEPTVELGRSVEMLDLLGRSLDGKLCTHAPVSGKVTGIGGVRTTSGDLAPAVEIKVTKDEGFAGLEPRPAPERPESLAGWADLCDHFGLFNGVDRCSLSEMFRRAQTSPVDHLIIRAMGAEPSETAAPAVLLQQGTTMIQAAECLAEALGAKKTWITVAGRFRQGRRLLARIARDTRVTPITLPDRYPQTDPRMLVRSVCGRVVPANHYPEDHGVCVLDTPALAAFADMIFYALPATHGVVTVTGDAVRTPADYRVPLGTSVGDLLEHVDTAKPVALVAAGGVLRGESLPHADVVISDGTTSLAVMSRDAVRVREPQACTRCGWCVEDCPVGLDPAALMNLAEQFAFDRASGLHPEVCVECGVCTYVCPSHLELARGVRSLKRPLSAPAESGR